MQGSRFLSIAGFVVVLLFLGHVLVSRAQESATPVYVTKADFDAAQSASAQESRALREQIYNLRQQVLEQRILKNTGAFSDQLVEANAKLDSDMKTRVCAEASSKIAAYEDEWAQILAFWPLGSQKLDALETLKQLNSSGCAVFVPVPAPTTPQ